jgi:hypothetical protein
MSDDVERSSRTLASDPLRVRGRLSMGCLWGCGIGVVGHVRRRSLTYRDTDFGPVFDISLSPQPLNKIEARLNKIRIGGPDLRVVENRA